MQPWCALQCRCLPQGPPLVWFTRSPPIGRVCDAIHERRRRHILGVLCVAAVVVGAVGRVVAGEGERTASVGGAALLFSDFDFDRE